MKKRLILACAAAGAVNGLCGAGGGAILVPLLGRILPKSQVFPASLAIMLPICMVSLATGFHSDVLHMHALPFYLAGSAVGGVLAGRLNISVGLLHRIFGAGLIMGGIHMLW